MLTITFTGTVQSNDMRYTQGGTPVRNIRCSTRRYAGKNEDGSAKYEYINISAAIWGTAAESEFLGNVKEGQPFNFTTDNISADAYTTESGEMRTSLKCNVRDFEVPRDFSGENSNRGNSNNGGNSSRKSAPQPPVAEDEIPF